MDLITDRLVERGPSGSAADVLGRLHRIHGNHSTESSS
jgi:hypothetical protein